MELAASDNKGWKEGDTWQYMACLLGQRYLDDPFHPTKTQEAQVVAQKGKGKRPAKQEAEKAQKPKRQKKPACHLFNMAPRGFPYSRECIFTHRCTNWGAWDNHSRVFCPTLQGTSSQVPDSQGNGALFPRPQK